MEVSLFVIGAVLIIVLLDLWAIVSVYRSTKRSGTKLGWAILIVVLPFVGLVIWGITGPRGVAIPPTSSEHSKG
ncbi:MULTISPECIES: PLD nuclease N-terminal domain-containing protein [Pseudomonas]|jgi:hypothetical protein|uniref:PLDc_N domain-containing protein n=1 Tax=Pseudomonas folii TaxID=2762593 RepID=A0ABR7B5J4_9PSED|nr:MULTISPECIES: PLD nuclease N-terminal domain-containing protein [Pseudomonas]MBC3952431.1 PLDc_N domain-containing protein [Pseudomonas folii]